MLVSVACSSAGTPVPTTEPSRQSTSTVSARTGLAVAIDRWERAGLNSYSFQMTNDCGECDPSSRAPQQVVVRSGATTDPSHPTVEELFTRIEDAIAVGRTVEVDYHPELGYPLDIGFDMQDRVFDGGYHLLISDLEPTD